MKTIPLHNGKTLCAVKVPEGSLKIAIHRQYLVMGINVSDVKGKISRIDRNDNKGSWVLPPGNWRILALATEMNDEQKEEVCESESGEKHGLYGICYKDYSDQKVFSPHFNNVDLSYASFLATNKLTNELLLIKD